MSEKNFEFKGTDPRTGKPAIFEIVHLEPLTAEEDAWLSEQQYKAAQKTKQQPKQ